MLTVAFASALAAGLLVGVFTPKPAEAVSIYHVYLHPTADHLTCGWHTGACYDDDSQVVSGWALDWNYGPNSSFTVNWISKSDNGAGSSVGGTGNISYISGSCQNWTYVGVNGTDGYYKNETRYVHTSTTQSGTWFYFASGYTPQTTTTSIGTAANETGCGSSWTGYHAHIEQTGGWDSKLSYPDHTTCNVPNITTDCGPFNNYTYPMYGDTWSLP
jgi:hypothetical protein